MTKMIQTHGFMLKKTGSYYVTHISVAALVAYAVTGDLAALIIVAVSQQRGPTFERINPDFPLGT